MSRIFSFFFFNDTATTEIYTLSLHDALPICVTNCGGRSAAVFMGLPGGKNSSTQAVGLFFPTRSEEHTSELQSPCNLVCRLLLEKKKTITLACPAGRTPPSPSASHPCLLIAL